MQSFREKLERGELLKVPNASGKAAFSGMIFGGGSYVWGL